MGKYSIDSPEGEFQSESNNKVLANQLDIVSVDEMNEVELMLLNQLYEEVLLTNLPNRTISVDDLKLWHRRWLGNVYKWAGQERSVNVSKGGFLFASAALIPNLLGDFDKKCLSRWTPCSALNTEDLVEGVAVTHVELILIHPFREGNGRLSRLLADVMMVQAGREPMDYSAWDTHKQSYIGAIHEGFRGNFEPMKYWVRVASGLSDGGLNLPV